MHYAALEVDPDADAASIRRAYRKQALRWHPDKNPEPSAADAFRRVAAAWEVLGSEPERAAYDARLRAGMDDDDADGDADDGCDYRSDSAAAWRAWEAFVAEEQRDAEERRRRERSFVRRLLAGFCGGVVTMGVLWHKGGGSDLLFPRALSLSNRQFASLVPMRTEFKAFTAQLQASRAAEVSDWERLAADRLEKLLCIRVKLNTPYLRLRLNASDVIRPSEHYGSVPSGGVLVASKRRVGKKVHRVWTFVRAIGAHPTARWWPPRDEACVRLTKSGTISTKPWFEFLRVQPSVDGRLRPFGLAVVPPAECRRTTGLPALIGAGAGAVLASWAGGALLGGRARRS